MKVLGNGARTGLVIREKIDFEYKFMKFTAYKEKFIDHVKLTIISDDTSDVVFKKNIYEESCFFCLDDEVFVVLDDYTEENVTEVDRLFSMLSKWSF